MRRITLALALPLVLTAMSASADKVGVVDMAYLFQHAPQAEAADRQLQQAIGPARQQMQEKQEEYEELAEQLERDSLVMDEQEQEELEARMQEIQREIQQMEHQFQQQLGQQQDRAMAEIQQLIAEVSEEVAAEQGFDLVVGQGVLYAADEVNLTDRVLERLRERADN